MDVSDSIPIGVKPGLESAQAYLIGQAEMLETELLDLQKYVAALMERWNGGAAINYHEIQQQWDTAAMNLFGPQGVLGEISQRMGMNWDNYAMTENANTLMFRRA